LGLGDVYFLLTIQRLNCCIATAGVRNMQDLEQAIREHAYHLWTANGRQEGNAEAHWLTAQREILASSLGTLGNVSSTPRTPRKAAKKTPSKKVRAA
jgi:hypothetical protein